MYGLGRSTATLLALVGISDAFVARSAIASNGIPLNTSDAASIKRAAGTVVSRMMQSYYTGTDSDQLLPSPYYWWQAGALLGGLIDYWAYTRDDTYVELIGNGLVSQAAPTIDFDMPDQHSGMGNDDQGFWALAAMSALEENLPVPAGSPATLWYQLTTNVFNEYVARWNVSTCNGGLRWQVFPDNTGYDYKSTIANGVFMQLGARLERYTGNGTYGVWAERVFSWLETTSLIHNETNWRVADGAPVESNCTDIDQAFWTYNAAAAMYTAASMYASGRSDTWHARLLGIVNMTVHQFFSIGPNATDIMYEAQCEPANACNTDQTSFKAYLARWLGKTALLVPELRPTIAPMLQASAAAAAQACSGLGNATCGTKWYVAGFDGKFGLGQDMAAYETIQSLLVLTGDAPLPGTAGNSSSTPAVAYRRLTDEL